MKSLIFIAFSILCHSVYSQQIKIMSYNIRLDLASDGENRWDNRKEMLAGQLQFYAPDFIGVQETLHHQLTYLDSTLTNYNYIGTARDDGK
jgi:mRNA deadenylase 3'-5' endonuclease subunit Ccr4